MDWEDDSSGTRVIWGKRSGVRTKRMSVKGEHGINVRPKSPHDGKRRTHLLQKLGRYARMGLLIIGMEEGELPERLRGGGREAKIKNGGGSGRDLTRGR